MIFLKTKLNIPPLRKKLVVCQRLIHKLHECINGKLTLISAPSGFGKTTLVCQWIDQFKVPAAWYSLDVGDNESSVFLRYLLAALQKTDNSLEGAFDPLFQGQRKLVGRDIMAQVVNELSKLSHKIHLVLDDYHVIQSRAVHDDLLFLLQNAPHQLHITIITRQDPPFPPARLRARQDMTEFRATQLRFKQEETAMFFAKTMELDLSREQVNELHSRTEGWIVGLQIIGLSLKKSGDLRGSAKNLSTPNKYLLDYLFEEVLANQKKEIQDFLIETSILKQLNADLCNELTGTDNAIEMLEQIERANLFITPLDNKREWYRYHSLFAEMLQHRLKRFRKKSIHELHKKASLWFVKEGYLEEAFQHGFNTNDMYFAAELLESNILSLLTSYEWAAARRWFEKIPPEILEKRFMLGLSNAFLLFLQEEFTDIDKTIANLEKTINDATKWYPADKRQYAQGLLLALKVSCLFYKDFAQVLPVAKEALKKISPKNKIALWLVQAVLSDAYTQQGEIQPALEHVKTSLSYFKHAEPKDSVYIKFHLLNKQAGLERLQGRLKNAEKLLKNAFEYAREAGISLRPAMAMLNVTLAQVYYSQNRLKKALDNTEECIKYTKPVSDIGFLLLGYRMKAFIHQVLGESGMAKEIMEEALAIAHQTKSAIRIASTELSAVRLALMQSDLEAVSNWTKRRRLNVDEPFSSNFEEECLTLAQYYMAGKKVEVASDILIALYPRTHKRKRYYSALRINIIRAGVLDAFGEQVSALRILENCTEFASQQGIVRPFADNSKYISKLLLSLRKSENGMVRIYVSKLLKEIELDRVSELRRQQCLVGLIDPLSQREIEILRLIVIGLKNKEIASNIFVSPNTVKTHIRNIYGKLCVANRKQAILRAQELNII